MDLNSLIQTAVQQNASDIHITAGVPPKFRIDGDIFDMEGAPAISSQFCEQLAAYLLGHPMDTAGEEDHSFAIGNVRIRANIFRASGVPSFAFRLLPDTIPELETLGLPPVVSEFPKLRRGLVLVTGEAGAGKTTTMASILKRINETRRDHIITLEDPIEYIHRPVMSLIEQREIGRDTESYGKGTYSILREDPDIILIGELRDLVTIEAALMAAETGNLVFATLHTNSAADSIDRMVDLFPAERQKQIRSQIAQTLQAVLVQQLVKKQRSGRVAACEVMVVNGAIRNLIREGKTPQIANAVATTADIGSVTMDNSLIRLFREKVITPEVARNAAHDVEYVSKNTIY